MAYWSPVPSHSHQDSRSKPQKRLLFYLLLWRHSPLLLPASLLPTPLLGYESGLISRVIRADTCVVVGQQTPTPTQHLVRTGIAHRVQVQQNTLLPCFAAVKGRRAQHPTDCKKQWSPNVSEPLMKRVRTRVPGSIWSILPGAFRF